MGIAQIEPSPTHAQTSLLAALAPESPLPSGHCSPRRTTANWGRVSLGERDRAETRGKSPGLAASQKAAKISSRKVREVRAGMPRVQTAAAKE